MPEFAWVGCYCVLASILARMLALLVVFVLFCVLFAFLTPLLPVFCDSVRQHCLTHLEQP